MIHDPLRIEGQTIAEKYRIDRAVGEGGFAVVYRAIHTIWNQPVAIKFFNGLTIARLDQREQFMKAFIQEGALLTELSSQTASIVQARDIGTYVSPDGHWIPFMVLEWLEGGSLDSFLEREQAEGVQPWSIPEMMGVITPVAVALEVAHARGIAHRDIKPANLFVLGDKPRSGRPTIKVLDFGVAKMMSDTQIQAALAKTGESVKSFSPQYGAPEQFSRRYGATGPWTDVFALALVAVELLRGRPALEGEDLVQLAYVSADLERRPTPRTFGVPVPDAVEEVFAKALAVQPTDRYARAADFLTALDAATRQGGLSKSQSDPRSGYVEPARVSSDDAFRATVASSDNDPIVTVEAPKAPTLTPSSSSATGSTNFLATGGATPPRSRPGLVVGGVLAACALAAGAFITLGRGHASSAPPQASAAPSVAAAPVPVKKDPVCPKDMATIPAGQFFMGSDRKESQANEKPSHNVKLDAFCIDLYEATADDYKGCSDIGKCRRAPTEVEWEGITKSERKLYSQLCTIADPEKQDHPINCVTWDMANTFCKAQDKRLPTEAEWEYTARGPDGRMYPWGDEEPTAAHLNACGAECVAWGKSHGVQLDALYSTNDGYPTTAPVGKFPAGRSRFGPFDIVGNVWEWTADWYGAYGPADVENPTGPATGEKRVIRGGAFNGSFANWLQPSFRYAQDPNARSHGVGFRCAKTLK